MESQPQNPEFRTNPENFHPCKFVIIFVSFFISMFSLLVHLQLIYQTFITDFSNFNSEKF